MKQTFFYILGLLSTVIFAQSKGELTAQQIDELISKMTVEEKVGQMAQITLDVITKGENEAVSDEPLQLNDTLVRKAILEYKVGSVLNTANNRARTVDKWREVIGFLQQVAVKESRLKIPIIYGIDAIHGTTYTVGATFFPQQIGIAAARNEELAKQIAEITAYETRASGIPWNFSPVLDLGRDPRFPRMWETFGEDPYLSGVLGASMIKGYEGEPNLSDHTYSVASCLKHFLGYTVARSGKDRTPSIISDIDLREMHIPPFKKAIDAGASSVMISSGIINGISVHANKKIITDLLKDELGFQGLVVTDWADIENLHKRDRVAATMKEAVKVAINAGIDMSMIPYNFKFCDYLVELVKEGEVSQERIDDAVRRVIQLKSKLGLFDTTVFAKKAYAEFGSKAHQETAYKSAAQSITLLKNKNNILPLNKSIKVLVAGPNSNSMRTLNGGWSYSWQGEKVEEFAAGYNTILESLQNKIGKEHVLYEEGVSYNHEGKYWEEKDVDITAAVDAAQSAEIILLCLGENSYTEKPGDLHDLSLSQNQINLAKALAKTGKPIVLILNEGRPRIIREIEPLVSAIVQIYLPGNYGGDALADVLFGDYNPSGKLPYTYPLYANTLMTYDYKPSENQVKMEGVYDYESDFAIQYPFGHGLSYTTFTYTDLQVNALALDGTQQIDVSVTVKNTGSRKGAEVVEVYVSDEYASLSPDTKNLRAFKKVELEPGKQQTIKFSLNPTDFSLINADLKRVIEKGEFIISINDLKKKIVITKDQFIAP